MVVILTKGSETSENLIYVLNYRLYGWCFKNWAISWIVEKKRDGANGVGGQTKIGIIFTYILIMCVRNT